MLTAVGQNVQDQGTSLRSWSQKKCLLPIGIFIFFFKIPPILKLEVGFFSGKKKFFSDFPKYGKFFLSKLHFCKFSKKLENIFLRKKVPATNGEFDHFFQNTPDFES